MTNESEESKADVNQGLSKYHIVGLSIGLFFGFVVSREIREAFRESAGDWGSLGISVVLSALSAGTITYIVAKLLERKSAS
ncbi:MAG: hypothetical protein ACIAZJ_03210 [Gimesia chilikensis]|uniref:hypothetical protein n=1 Tax=Gimesia chilikensis TaxID=2605989 RepID=UPI0037B8BF59